MATEKITKLEDLKEGDALSIKNPLTGEPSLSVVVDRAREYIYSFSQYDEEKGEYVHCRTTEKEDGTRGIITPEEEGRNSDDTELRLDILEINGASVNLKEVTHGNDVLEGFEVHKIDEEHELYDSQYVDRMRNEYIPFMKMMENEMQDDENLRDEDSSYNETTTDELIEKNPQLGMLKNSFPLFGGLNDNEQNNENNER